MSNLTAAAMQSVAHRPGQLFPEPHREGVFDRNWKDDGVAYADAKTKARRFDLNKIGQPYNPNRVIHMTAKDALIDPHVTIRHEDELPKKDPGYTNLVQ